MWPWKEKAGEPRTDLVERANLVERSLARDMAATDMERGMRDVLATRILNTTPVPQTTYPLSDPDAWRKLFHDNGPDVVTPQRAMEQGAVYACVSRIALSIASMPIICFRRQGKKKIVDADLPQAKLLGNSPNPRYGRSVFWRQSTSDMALNGNGIVWIERRGATPIAMWNIPWSRVGINFYRAPNGRTRLLYHLVMDEGVHIRADQDDVLHIPGSVVWNIFYSVSPISAYALLAGIALQADRFAESYFRNSSSPDGFIKVAGSLGKGQAGSDAADEYRKRWMSRFNGPNRFGGPAVLDGGAEFVPVRINAADAQLIESRQFNVRDISRIFHVPPHLINDFDKIQAFGKGLAELNQAFITYSLGPHLDAIEVELNRKLFLDDPNHFCEFDRQSLLRGDIKSRYEALQIALGGAQGPGFISQNEARQDEGYEPLGPEFDKPLQWGASAPTAPDNGKSNPNPAKPARPKKDGDNKDGE